MYYRDLETSREKMAQHNEAMKASARARLDKIAAKKWENRKDKKEAQA